VDGRGREYKRVSGPKSMASRADVSVGDGEWKPSGVTAEPEVTSRILNGVSRLRVSLMMAIGVGTDIRR
jgi:hypothetical protein